MLLAGPFALGDAVFDLDHCVHEVLARVVVGAQHAQRGVVVQTHVSQAFFVEEAKHVVCSFKVGLLMQTDDAVLLLELRTLMLGVALLTQQVVACEAFEQGLTLIAFFTLAESTINRFFLSWDYFMLLTQLSYFVKDNLL